MINFNKIKNYVGIDINGEIARLALISLKNNNIEYVNFYEISLFSNSFIIPTEFKKNIDFFAASIPTQMVFKKLLTFSKILNYSDIEYEINNNHEQYFPGFGENFYFDFVSIYNHEDLKNNHYIAYAAKKETIDEIFCKIKKIIGHNKIHCLDLDSFSLIRPLIFSGFFDLAHFATAFIYITNNNIRSIIFNKNEILFDYQENFIADEYEIHAICGKFNSITAEISNMSNNMFLSLEKINKFIKRQIESFRLTEFSDELKNIAIFSGSELESHIKKTNQIYDLPIVFVNPYEYLKIKCDKPENFLMSFGLALRGIDDEN